MVSQKVFCGVLLLVGCLLAGQSYGRTWYVERNGSGDFTVIQDAVNAASSGDEIHIGPGRYTEYTQHSWGKAYVLSDGTKNLTFVGSGAEQSIIGPSTYAENYDEYGIASLAGNIAIVLEDLRFQNLNYRGIGSLAREFVVRRCMFDHCYTGGIFSSGASTAVFEDCNFIDGAGVFSGGIIAQVPHVLVERCTFSSYASGVDVNHGGATDVVVRDCSFIGGELGEIGVNVTMGSGALVEGCSFQDLNKWGLAYNNAGVVVFRDNVVESSGGWGVSLSVRRNTL